MRVFEECGPPLFVTLAAYAGWKPTKRARSDLVEGDALASYLSQFPGGQMTPG
jgi:hypothetical protein